MQRIRIRVLLLLGPPAEKCQGQRSPPHGFRRNGAERPVARSRPFAQDSARQKSERGPGASVVTTGIGQWGDKALVWGFRRNLDQPWPISATRWSQPQPTHPHGRAGPARTQTGLRKAFHASQRRVLRGARASHERPRRARDLSFATGGRNTSDVGAQAICRHPNGPRWSDGGAPAASRWGSVSSAFGSL